MNKKNLIKALDYLKNKLRDDQDAVLSIDYILGQVHKKLEESQHVSDQIFPLPENWHDHHNPIAIYSDGACRGNPGPGAWGVVAQMEEGKFLFESSGIEMLTTNNKMELEGAIQGIEQVLSLDHFDPQGNSVLVYSDSRYVVDGVQKWVSNWKKRGWKKSDGKVPENFEQWQKLDELNSRINSVEYFWVKGHAGHPQNEYCDQLANIALNEAGF